MKMSSVNSVQFVLVVICGVVVASAFASPAGQQQQQHQQQQQQQQYASSRAFKDIILPGAGSSTNLTKGTIDSSLSVLGTLFFTIAFVIIPVLSLLYTSGTSWVPVAARSLKKASHHSRLTRSIIDNDRCIERIVCELSRGARNSRADRWTDVIFNNVANDGKGFMKRVSDVYKARQMSCETYSCEPIGFIARLAIYVFDWNTILKA